jgi:hypothetical protein
LLNTYITEDDNEEQERQFEEAINDYRLGKVNYSSDSIEVNKLAHVYIPQYLLIAGLVTLERTPQKWEMREGTFFPELCNIVLEDDFLENFYKNRIN